MSSRRFPLGFMNLISVWFLQSCVADPIRTIRKVNDLRLFKAYKLIMRPLDLRQSLIYNRNLEPFAQLEMGGLDL